MEPKKYTIGDKIFIQKTLVLGQWKELGAIINDLRIPGDLNPASLVGALGSNLFAVLAIVLTEDGKPLKGKDIPALASEIEYGITPETAIEVIADFFDLNPIASLLNNLNGLTVTIKEKLTAIGLTNSVTSSVEETSQNETGSSGTLQSPKPETGPSES